MLTSKLYGIGRGLLATVFAATLGALTWNGFSYAFKQLEAQEYEYSYEGARCSATILAMAAGGVAGLGISSRKEYEK